LEAALAAEVFKVLDRFWHSGLRSQK